MTFNERAGIPTLLGASIALVLAGCSGSSNTTRLAPDGGVLPDASFDASMGIDDATVDEGGADDGGADVAVVSPMDAGVDAPAVVDADAPVDASPEASVDASPEAGVDASPEAGVDASPEAGVDASPEAGVDASPEADLDASLDASVDASDAGPTCSFGSAASTATNSDLNLFGQPAYFDNGAVLPAGKYRLKYVDGCMQYGAGQNWTVQAYANGTDAFWLVGDTTSDKVILPPGTSGYDVSTGAYLNFDDCVAANLAVPPLDFDFAGGKLGVWLQDTPYSDNVAGVNGDNPKWSLTFLGTCTNPE
jgi:hypothetical protein